MKLKRGKKSGLKYFSYQDIKSWKPCYDPVSYIPATWRGTAIDILKLEQVPIQDRLWVVLRPEIVSERVMRLFAVWCARQALSLRPNPDPRSVNACDVAERFAEGKATTEEVRQARREAYKVYYAAASAAYYAAADAAAASAAYYAANAAAYYAASAAAYYAASAVVAARSTQRDKLIEMLLAEGLEHVARKQRSTK